MERPILRLTEFLHSLGQKRKLAISKADAKKIVWDAHYDPKATFVSLGLLIIPILDYEGLLKLPNCRSSIWCDLQKHVQPCDKSDKPAGGSQDRNPGECHEYVCETSDNNSNGYQVRMLNCHVV